MAKIKAPIEVKQICHHARVLREDVPCVPVLLLRSWVRHTPSSGTTVLGESQDGSTQEPLLNTCPLSEHAKQLLGPGPAQLEQLGSQSWQDEPS
jgi:hypothetical protein